MESKELRIGNYISVYGEFKNVESIGYYGIGFNGGFAKYKLPNLEPIPLTEELLLKCGFEDCNSYKDYRLYLPPHQEAYLELSIRNGIVCGFGISEDPMLLDLEYVHQLQNIYFALTGQELEIKF